MQRFTEMLSVDLSIRKPLGFQETTIREKNEDK